MIFFGCCTGSSQQESQHLGKEPQRIKRKIAFPTDEYMPDYTSTPEYNQTKASIHQQMIDELHKQKLEQQVIDSYSNQNITERRKKSKLSSKNEAQQFDTDYSKTINEETLDKHDKFQLIDELKIEDQPMEVELQDLNMISHDNNESLSEQLPSQQIEVFQIPELVQDNQLIQDHFQQSLTVLQEAEPIVTVQEAKYDKQVEQVARAKIALRLIKQSKYSQALQLLQSIDMELINVKSKAIVYNLQGICLTRINKIDEAIKQFDLSLTFMTQKDLNLKKNINENLKTCHQYQRIIIQLEYANLINDQIQKQQYVQVIDTFNQLFELVKYKNSGSKSYVAKIILEIAQLFKSYDQDVAQNILKLVIDELNSDNNHAFSIVAQILLIKNQVSKLRISKHEGQILIKQQIMRFKQIWIYQKKYPLRYKQVKDLLFGDKQKRELVFMVANCQQPLDEIDAEEAYDNFVDQLLENKFF